MLSNKDIAKQSCSTSLFAWSCQNNLNPIVIDRAQGVHFWDNNNNKYLDFNSQTMCVNVGHGDRRVIEAIKQQLERVAYVNAGATTEVRAQLGTLLQEVTPGDLSKAYFTTSGTEANEHAIRMARSVTGREKIIARYRSYHGSTAGSISLTGDPRRWNAGPGMPGVIHAMDPFPAQCRWCSKTKLCTLDCLNHIEDIIRFEGPNNIAAVIIEPVVGTNGILIPPDGYLEGLRELTERNNILLIADEVMSGFGRTGRWFAVDHWKVVPDIMTIAKGLTSAYVPLGAVMVNDKVAHFFDDNTLYSGSTYNSHPLACAAAVACINIYKEDRLIENAALLGIILKNTLDKIKLNHSCVGQVRSIGLFGVMELVKSNGQPLVPFNADIAAQAPVRKLKEYLLDHGLFVFTCWNNLFVIPPLCISSEELLNGMDIIDEGLRACKKDFH